MKPKESKVHQKQIKIKINIRNILPWTIILYGIIGIIASTASIIFLNYQDIDIIDNSISQEFRDMSKYMMDASTSAKNAGNSLRSAEQTMNSGKTTAQSAGNLIFKISDYVGFTIPLTSIRPLSNTYNLFQNAGNDIINLGNNLENLGRNLNQNAQDMDMMSKNLEEVSRKMQDISLKVDGNQISQNISKTGWVIYTLLFTHFFMFILIGFAIRK